MKKFILLSCCLIAAFSASAQLQKGVVLLGGNVGFNNVSEDGVSATVINLSPQALFFTSNRFAAGGILTVAVQTGDVLDATTIGIAPAVRYYFNEAGNSRFFGQFSLGYQNISSGGASSGGASIGIGVGADFFINNRVAIEGMLGYSRFGLFDDFGGYNQIGLNFGVAAFIGGGGE